MSGYRSARVLRTFAWQTATLAVAFSLSAFAAAEETNGLPVVHGAASPPTFVRPMHEVDLGIPTLSELSEGRSSDLETIPDYARLAIGDHRPANLGWGGSRAATLSVVTWEAPAFRHRPLYFEEPNLERYGYHFGLLQPAVSAGTLCGRVLAFPYLMASHPPRSCVYPLGQCRPGDAVPFQCETPHFSLPGTAAEAAAAVALIAVIP